MKTENIISDRKGSPSTQAEAHVLGVPHFGGEGADGGPAAREEGGGESTRRLQLFKISSKSSSWRAHHKRCHLQNFYLLSASMLARAPNEPKFNLIPK
ncbi:MAG: hypothetical protein KDD53_04020 [Bdellovibrionales bacterium]|nr:hypothetical protein [Bdellovibrionales bacterium]